MDQVGGLILLVVAAILFIFAAIIGFAGSSFFTEGYEKLFQTEAYIRKLVTTTTSYYSRESLDKLKNIKTSNESKQHLIKVSFEKLQKDLSQTIRPYGMNKIVENDVVWANGINPYKLSYDELLDYYNELSTSYQIDILTIMYQTAYFPIYDRYNFLIDVIRRTKDTRLFFKAASLMNLVAVKNDSFWNIGKYSSWWEENKEIYKTKPEDTNYDPKCDEEIYVIQLFYKGEEKGRQIKQYPAGITVTDITGQEKIQEVREPTNGRVSIIVSRNLYKKNIKEYEQSKSKVRFDLETGVSVGLI